MTTFLTVVGSLAVLCVLVLVVIKQMKGAENRLEGEKKALKNILKENKQDVKVINELIKKNNNTKFNSINDIINSLP